jgi:hypothetical protein
MDEFTLSLTLITKTESRLKTEYFLDIQRILKSWKIYFSKERNRGGKSKYDIFDTLLRTFINATVYPHPAQQ